MRLSLVRLAQAATTRTPAGVVREALLQGVCTTQDLHARLHSEFSPLPARPPPSNFLQGYQRQNPDRPAPSPNRRFPGQAENTQGSWSMAYLKRKVLAGMESRNEVLKITRARWDRIRGATPIEGEPVEEAEEAPTTTTKSTAGKKKANKKAATHVWVLSSMWNEASASQDPASRPVPRPRKR